jgi:cytochrome bd-type quinol oxidase subunit 1
MNPATKWVTCRKPNWLPSKPSGTLNRLRLPLPLFGIPNQDKMENSYAIQIPYALGLIATRSTDTQVTGLKDLMAQHEVRIRNGIESLPTAGRVAQWQYRSGGSRPSSIKPSKTWATVYC